MKSFIENKILFPKYLGFMPYFWVFSLFLMSGQLLSGENNLNLFNILLVVIFLKFYHDGYSLHRFIAADIVIQLVIAIYFTQTFPNTGGPLFFIYTAWQIGSLPFSQKRFLRFYFLYLLTIILCTLDKILQIPITLHNLFGIVIVLTFTFGSPLASRSLGNSYRRRYRMQQNNRRLETIIKQNERDRIAKDLHDNIGQSFSIITLKAELATKLIEKDPQKALQQLKDITKTSREDLNLVRKIVANLNEKTIASAMIEEEKNLSIANIRQISINEQLSNEWPKNIQHVLASIIKETTTNVLRYSQANNMKFFFQEDDNNFLLEISDDGIGFKNNKENQSFGIEGMKKRLIDFDGQLEVISQHGVKLKITIPRKD
jgi:two-component system sensor histidine kinase DesK